MIYHRDIRIEFNHCDPAGIVFYPRYLEMTNSVCENFFREVAGYSYAEMMAAHQGTPTVRAEVSYHAPTRLGEVIDWRLSVTRLGTSSIGLRNEAYCGGLLRVTVDLTLVFVGGGLDGDLRPQPWPPAVRDRIAAFAGAG
ncbi:acyl-CoA thioesterase [Rhodopseudomonas palustris]